MAAVANVGIANHEANIIHYYCSARPFQRNAAVFNLVFVFITIKRQLIKRLETHSNVLHYNIRICSCLSREYYRNKFSEHWILIVFVFASCRRYWTCQEEGPWKQYRLILYKARLQMLLKLFHTDWIFWCRSFDVSGTNWKNFRVWSLQRKSS